MTCPTNEELSWFLEHGIDATIEDHLGQCETCRMLVLLARGDEPPEERDPRVPLRDEASGRYVELEPLGEGGQALVFSAFDQDLARPVAYKTLIDTVDAESAAARRFVREARIAAQMAHPAVVPVFEVGRRSDGAPYYTMQLIEGKPLSSAIASASSLSSRLKLLRRIVPAIEALALAHDRGIAHRDIKPDNIMIGDRGETFLLDWGLASLAATGCSPSDPGALDGDLPDALTATRGVVGTPAYMSPELVAGGADRRGASADVWALGVVLYELFASQRPFSGTSTAQLFDSVAKGAFVPLAKACPDVPPELQAIVERCLEHDPDARYDNAALVASDLTAFLDGQLVQAFDYTAWDRFKRFARRHRVVVSAATVVALALVISLFVVIGAYSRELEATARAERAHSQASASRDSAASAARAAEISLALAQTELANNHLGSGDFAQAGLFAASAIERLRRHETVSENSELAEVHADALLNGKSILFLAESEGLFWLREMRRLATAPQAIAALDRGGLAVADADGTIHYQDAAGRAVVLDMGEPAAFLATDNPGYIAAATRNEVRVWRVGETKPIAIRSEQAINRIAIARDRNRLVWADGSQGCVYVWDFTGTEVPHCLKGHDGKAFAVDISVDGRLGLSGGLDGKLKFWNLERGELIAEAHHHQSWTYAVQFSEDEHWAYTTGPDGLVIYWQLAPLEPIDQVDLKSPGLRLAISSEHVFALTAVGSIIAFTPRLENRTGIQAHSASIANSFALAERSTLFTAGADGFVKTWHVANPGRHFIASGPDEIPAAAFSANGGALYLAQYGGRMHRLDLHDGSTQHFSLPKAASAKSVAFSPTGELVAIANVEGVISVHATSTGEKRGSFSTSGGIACLAFTPDLAMLIAGSGHVVHRFGLDGRRFDDLATPPRGSVTGCTTSASGLVALTTTDGFYAIDLDSASVAAELERGRWYDASFSRDGALLVAVGEGGVVSWRTEDWKRLWSMQTDEQGITVEVSPTGRLVAVGAVGRSYIIDAIDGGLVLRFAQKTPLMTFSPDEEWLATVEANAVMVRPMGAAKAHDRAGILERYEARTGMSISGVRTRLVDPGQP